MCQIALLAGVIGLIASITAITLARTDQRHRRRT